MNLAHSYKVVAHEIQIEIQKNYIYPQLKITKNLMRRTLTEKKVDCWVIDVMLLKCSWNALIVRQSPFQLLIVSS